MNDHPIQSAARCIGEAEPEILASLSLAEVCAEMEALTARLLVLARQRQQEES